MFNFKEIKKPNAVDFFTLKGIENLETKEFSLDENRMLTVEMVTNGNTMYLELNL